MSTSTRVRGQPLVALLAVLAGWAGGRISTWEAPLHLASPAAQQAEAAVPGPQTEGGFFLDQKAGPQSPPLSDQEYYSGNGYGPDAFGYMPAGMVQPSNGYFQALWPASRRRPRSSAIDPRGAWYGPNGNSAEPGGWYGIDRLTDRYPAGQQFPADHGEGGLTFDRREGLPAGFSSLSSFAAQPYPSGSVATGPIASQLKPRRWSADSWALMRKGGSGPLVIGAMPATYGASQAGAVLRYRLAMRARYNPVIYMRTTSTLGQQMRETAAAVGFSARPFPSIPVIGAVEGRLTEQAGRRRLQPVVMAVTEFPTFRMPADFRGEAYLQAGYVAGKFATPFADGQVRVDRRLLQLGPVETRVGAGLWGGAQRGAGRLDAGPSAAIAFPLGRGTFGRLAVDWRFRVIGDAQPGSGPALTLSAGF
ncbi:hypothetical protein [Novosphingobium sp. ST904]|uniref:hypothetical protein n=1 Tax=Novosphingobium sp. ST904 TaxID=1684385 RepID=UPI0006CE0DB3|nr:hypothetical protein [Novosphingobium sp. ST904]KPH59599.1 hypothetical protein ADT71_22750 [Novosphingobium sp. ST904]TCM38061.1 hypothetical protein EDF59_109120 [Novosphingobium sp. ST904]